jgi:membrane-bound lytic murein transglycosylase D
MSWLLRIASVLTLLIATASFPEAVRSDYNQSFTAPKQLAPRVQFWIDVFTKYGKHHVVIHHKLYPYIVFGVLDLTKEGSYMSPVSFDNLKANRVKTAIGNIKRAVQTLSKGYESTDPLVKRVKQQMAKFSRDREFDYRRILNEDLIRTQTGIKEKFSDSIARSGRYLPTMETIFRSHGLPIELTRLPFIESSFDYKAYSSVGAAGIWQFMRGTAVKYMRLNSVIDDRRDPIIATQGAALYLKQAYKVLGSWPLAVTSYNHGVAGVSRKVKASGTRDISRLIEVENVFGFASSNFYPELLAAVAVYNNFQDYFPQLRIEPLEKFVLRKVPYSMRASQIATYFGVSVASLQGINYALASRVWSGYSPVPKGYYIKIPLSRNYQSPDTVSVKDVLPPVENNVGPSFSSVRPVSVMHIVRRGETLNGIAMRFKTTVRQIQSFNGMRGSLVRIGQRLKIPSSRGVVPQQTLGIRPAPVAMPTSHPLAYKVRAGDTLIDIAKRSRVSVSYLTTLNGLRGSRIRVGQILKVPGQRLNVKVQSNSFYHSVGLGDSLWSIAKQYRVTISQLKRLNGLAANRIKVGQRIRVR